MNMAIGAIQSLKTAGYDMNKVIVAGIDATQDALAAMKTGDLDVTVFQNAAAQGSGAVDTALKLAKGESVEIHGLDPVRTGHARECGTVSVKGLNGRRFAE